MEREIASLNDNANNDCLHFAHEQGDMWTHDLHYNCSYCSCCLFCIVFCFWLDFAVCVQQYFVYTLMESNLFSWQAYWKILFVYAYSANGNIRVSLTTRRFGYIVYINTILGRALELNIEGRAIRNIWGMVNSKDTYRTLWTQFFMCCTT